MKFILFLCSVLSSLILFPQDISVITQQKSAGAIEVLAFSNNGNLLASGGKGDNTVKVWDINSGKIIGSLSGHEEDITSITFNKTDDKIISGSEDQKIIIWDIINWEIHDSSTTSAPVTTIAISDNNTIYSGDENGLVLKWKDLKINNPTTVHQADKAIENLQIWNNNLAFFEQGGYLDLIDLKTKAKKREKIHPLGILGFSFDKKNNGLMVASKDGKVALCRLDSLTVTKTIKTGSLIINSFTAHPVESAFIISTASKVIKMMNTKGELLVEFKGKTEDDKSPITGLCMSPDGSILASAGTLYAESLKGRKANSVIKLWDTKRGIINQTLEGQVNAILTFDFNPSDKRLVFLGSDNLLTFWDLNSAEKYGDFTLPDPKREIPPRAKNMGLKKGLKLLDKAIKAATGDLSDLKNSNDARKVGTVLLKRTFTEKDIVTFSNDGKHLFTKLKNDEIRQYNLQNRKPESLRTIFSYQPVINGFVLSPNDKLMAVYGSGDSAVSIINLTTGEFVKKLSTPGPENFKLLVEAKSAAFSPDGQFLSVCFNTSKTYVWNTSTWNLAFENALIGNLGYAEGAYTNFTANGDQLIINTISGLQIYNTQPFGLFSETILQTKGYTLPINKPCDYAAVIKDNVLYFEHLTTKKVVKSIAVKPYMVSHVAAKPDGNIGVTLVNGQFFILNPSTGKDEIMLVSEGDNSIIKTHDNYYKVNKEGFDLVTFRIGNKAYPFEQFDAIYNRPDLVLKKLNCTNESLISLYEKAHSKRLSKLGISTASAKDLTKVPVCKITNKNNLTAITKDTQVTINSSFKDPSGLSSYNIWVNNVPLYGKKGKTINGTSASASAEVKLVYGINKIQVASRNAQGVESLLETVYIENIGEKPAPNMYLVTIGTSKYQDAKYNLNYAAKDANDLSSLMSENTNNVYNQVRTKNISNEGVTTEDVIALKAFVSEAGINDVVVIFVAGHGVLDDQFNYYFATHPMVFNNPKLKGLVYEDLEGLLDGIAAKKKILIMDTCHSGEIDAEEVFFTEEETVPEENVSFRSTGSTVENKTAGASPSKVMNELFNDLRRGTGATVISSAGGAEYALESDEWKNGLFSYCMLRGLKNGYADLNKDGEIYLSELQTYTIEKVRALSQGKQVPNSRIQNLELDFRVW